MVSEDKLTNKIIEHFEDQKYQEIEPEAHYNYYGDRGVADLYIENQGKCRVFELKNNPDSANEVLRQFNRMVEYFFKDKERESPVAVNYELCFLPTLESFQHITSNKGMYRTLLDKGHRSESVNVTFRSLDNPSNKISCFPQNKDFEIGDEEWREWAEEQGITFGAEDEI